MSGFFIFTFCDFFLILKEISEILPNQKCLNFETLVVSAKIYIFVVLKM